MCNSGEIRQRSGCGRGKTDREFTKSPGESSFEETCRHNGSDCVDLAKLLLDRGAELEPPPNYSGDSALNFACRNGNIDLVRLPLNRGIDPNRARWRHSGPLAEAAKNGDLVIALLLLEAGAKVSVGDSEPTYFSSSRPLVAAAWNGRLDMVALLLKHEEREDVVHEAKFAAREMGFYGIESVIEQHLDRDISPHSPMRIEELLDGEYTVGIMEG